MKLVKRGRNFFYILLGLIFFSPASVVAVDEWMAFGSNLDYRWNAVNKASAAGADEYQKLRGSHFSGSLEWTGVAKQEAVFTQIHIIPGYRGTWAGLWSNYQDLPGGDNPEDRLGQFSFFDFLTTYRLLDFEQYGRPFLGFWLGHNGQYYHDEGGNDSLYFSNFVLGPVLEYSFYTGKWFMHRVSGVLAFPLYSNNIDDLLYWRWKYDIYFPLNFYAGFQDVLAQKYMLKLSLYQTILAGGHSDLDILTRQTVLGLGFYWVY